jgi:hypothetical protein
MMPLFGGEDQALFALIGLAQGHTVAYASRASTWLKSNHGGLPNK